MYRGTTPTFTFMLPIECETISKLSVANKSSTSDGNITKAENAISNLKTACEGFEKDIGTLQEHAADTKSNPHKITHALIKAAASDTVGKAGGVAGLDSKTGQVPDAQLPRLRQRRNGAVF